MLNKNISLALKRYQLHDSIILIVLRSFAKFLLLGFIVLSAGYLSREEFGDFQFVLGVINMGIQPMIVIAIIITRIGCAYPAETMKSNLRWLYINYYKKFPLIFFVIVIIFILSDPFISKLANVRAVGSISIAGIIIATYLGYNFNLGFLQTLESFKSIGFLSILIGFFALLFSYIAIFMKLDTISLYISYSIAIMIALLFISITVFKKFPKETLAAKKPDRQIVTLSLYLTFSLIFFFIILNMDVIAAKFLFNRKEAGYYASLEIVGKINFLISTSLAMIIFPRAIKKYENGEKHIHYLYKGSIIFFAFALIIILFTLMFSNEIFKIGYGDNFNSEYNLLLVILIAKIFQSYMFFLINYEGVAISKHMFTIVLSILFIQIGFFILYHSTIFQIASNIAITSVIGSFVLFIHSLIRKREYLNTHCTER